MILVVGATGILGGTITRQLLAQGKEVRVLLRHNSPSEQLAQAGMATSAQTLLDAGAQPAYGDMKDRASLDAVLAGVQTVISTANSVLRGGEDTDGNRNLIEAAKAAGAEHFIFVSILGADPSSLIPLIQAKGQTEALLRESGMTYTILVPNVFMEVWVPMIVGPGLRGQPVPLVGEGQRRHSLISVADVAAYACAAVDHPAARNAYLPIGGPEPLSWSEIIARCSRLLGQEIETVSVTPDMPIASIPAPVLPLYFGFETFESPIPMEELSQTFGIPPTPLETAMARVFGRPTS
jgi:uncharacterized protein YbjT (DUF2867 family)